MSVDSRDAKIPSVVEEVLNLRFSVKSGVTAGQTLRDMELPNRGPQAIVAVLDSTGDIHDLAWSPEEDTVVDAIPANTEDGRFVMRHSCAHVLAQAVQKLFPDAKLGIGPAISDGFYYDFDVKEPFTPDDLVAIERAMRKIIKSGQQFRRRILTSVEDAQKEFAGQPYKLELIEDKSQGANIGEEESLEVGSGELTAYDNVNPRTGAVEWSDLCRGPHVPTTKYISAFHLTKSSAAYWRGDQSREDMQRIYGTAWESVEAMDAYLDQLAEAEKRDHRRLGAQLDLFSFPEEVGSGLPLFHPKGGIIRGEMEEHSRRRHIDAGYQFVETPHITKGELFKRSGHLDWYGDSMFPPMRVDEELNEDGSIRKVGQDYHVKPMNCPMHNLIFSSRGRSYRELPLRLFEFGTVYRYEKSGVIHGLTRARGFTQDDAHIYCTEDQLEEELTTVLKFVISLLKDFGLDDFYLELSTKDPEKFVGSDEIWERATNILESVATSSGLDLVPDPGGAAFYGPKISVQAKDAIGRTWQMSTVQLDFNLPELFNLEFMDSDGVRKQPIMIHRALFGSVERFFGVLTEHYAGAFPVWLSPVQVVGIPVADTFIPHLEDVISQLRAAGIRAEVDAGDDRMQKKIRTHTTQKVPFLLLAGARDVENGAVSFRFRDGTQKNGILVSEAIESIVEWAHSQRNDSPTAELLEESIAKR